MSSRQDTVAHVRAIMAPGNPVPGNAVLDCQQAPARQEAYDRIWALAQNQTAAPPQPARTREPVSRRPGEGRGRRPGEGGGWRPVIAPVAAALAVAGVITGVAFATRSLGPSTNFATNRIQKPA